MQVLHGAQTKSTNNIFLMFWTVFFAKRGRYYIVHKETVQGHTYKILLVRGLLAFPQTAHTGHTCCRILACPLPFLVPPPIEVHQEVEVHSQWCLTLPKSFGKVFLCFIIHICPNKLMCFQSLLEGVLEIIEIPHVWIRVHWHGVWGAAAVIHLQGY